MMSPWRLFEILGPATANDRCPTVTRPDGRTSSRLVDDNRRRLYTTQQVGQVTRRHAVKSTTANLNWIRSGARSQWRLARVSVSWAELLQQYFASASATGNTLAGSQQNYRNQKPEVDERDGGSIPVEVRGILH